MIHQCRYSCMFNLILNQTVIHVSLVIDIIFLLQLCNLLTFEDNILVGHKLTGTCGDNCHSQVVDLGLLLIPLHYWRMARQVTNLLARVKVLTQTALGNTKQVKNNLNTLTCGRTGRVRLLSGEFPDGPTTDLPQIELVKNTAFCATVCTEVSQTTLMSTTKTVFAFSETELNRTFQLSRKKSIMLQSNLFSEYNL